MTQSPLDPQNQPRRQDEPATGPRRPLTFDEMVALLVAFLSLGSVLFWGLSRGGMTLLGDSVASQNGAVTTPEGAQSGIQPFSFGTTDADEEDSPRAIAPAPNGESAAVALQEKAQNSARRELEAQAAARQARAPKRGLWDDMRAGVTSAAAGIAGVAAVSEPGEASPEATTEPATEEATTEQATEPATEPTAEATAEPTEAIALSEAAQAPPKDALEFSDVPDNYWAKPYIDALSSRELISGFEGGDFRPEQPVTRAQIANIVSRTFDLTSDKENLEFGDVTGDYWARESIGEVVKGGFMTGFPNDTFEPNAPVTRAQAFTTLVTGLNLPVPTNVQTSLSRYSDANNIPQWANEKVAAATANGIVVNYPKLDELNPEAPTTRAELSAMIYQALVNEGVVEPVETEYIVKP